MLVLSRRLKESIVIGDDIVITIVKLDGDQARIGIEAPKAVSVHRREVYEAIAAGRRAPAGEVRATSPSSPSSSPPSSPRRSKPRAARPLRGKRGGSGRGRS